MVMEYSEAFAATGPLALGERPPLGLVPEFMHAQVLRAQRFGEPRDAFAIETVPTPRSLAPDEVLIYVMAAGVNYNNVWAAQGVPLDVIAQRKDDRFFPDDAPFHVGGSDASGIVWARGSEVRGLELGDHVVVHCGQWHRDDPSLEQAGDPTLAASFRTWGYETNWGSYAQFARVQAHQCMPKPAQLSWEEAACCTLVGATAYRMLTHFTPHEVRPSDVVLVWGGAGGLGSMAIQIVRELGGIPVAVVSSDDRAEACLRLGARACVDRRRFRHWGIPPSWRDRAAYGEWLTEAKRFGSALWEALGERRSPRIVFEHPGELTMPTSVLVCAPGGMIVTCAGTTGYAAQADLRYLWMRQKRLQGSHFANDEQARAFNDLVCRGRIDPCLTRTFAFTEIGEAHQLLHENQHSHGNLACLVNAPERGLGRSAH
jgi:crotonyl-CoA carboxylase/reductase